MYGRSAAASSALGHVIGIGDRHGGNMALDVNRNEVVHIDFGVCFEQGQLLHMPEWVPFRLTREIVSAMGVSGTEGMFRSSMEMSMSCLRGRRSLVLSLLQTYLADPLARWQSVVEKLAHKMGGDSPILREVDDAGSAGSSVARGKGGRAVEPQETATVGSSGLVRHNETVRQTVEGAIDRVRQKLAGEEIVPGMQLSVRDQVDALVKQAQDPRRLCTMFEGWQMWA